MAKLDYRAASAALQATKPLVERLQAAPAGPPGPLSGPDRELLAEFERIFDSTGESELSALAISCGLTRTDVLYLVSRLAFERASKLLGEK